MTKLFFLWMIIPVGAAYFGYRMTRKLWMHGELPEVDEWEVILERMGDE